MTSTGNMKYNCPQLWPAGGGETRNEVASMGGENSRHGIDMPSRQVVWIVFEFLVFTVIWALIFWALDSRVWHWKMTWIIWDESESSHTSSWDGAIHFLQNVWASLSATNDLKGAKVAGLGLAIEFLLDLTVAYEHKVSRLIGSSCETSDVLLLKLGLGT